MREFIIERLNELLERDHDLIAGLLTREKVLSIDSDLTDHPATFKKQGVDMATALALFSFCIDGDPVQVEYEGDLIRKFY